MSVMDLLLGLILFLKGVQITSLYLLHLINSNSNLKFFTKFKHSDRDTHWCQTLFYFEEPIYVCQDQKISALLHVIPNSMNNRLLDIYFKNILGSGLTLFRPFK